MCTYNSYPDHLHVANSPKRARFTVMKALAICELRLYLKSFGASIEFGCTGIEWPLQASQDPLVASRPSYSPVCSGTSVAEANAGSNGSHRGVAETTQDASTTCLQG